MELGAAVPFAEGMGVIDVADDLARLAGEGIDVEITKIIVLADAAMDIGHAGFDILAELERLPSLVISSVRTWPAYS